MNTWLCNKEVIMITSAFARCRKFVPLVSKRPSGAPLVPMVACKSWRCMRAVTVPRNIYLFIAVWQKWKCNILMTTTNWWCNLYSTLHTFLRDSYTTHITCSTMPQYCSYKARRYRHVKICVWEKSSFYETYFSTASLKESKRKHRGGIVTLRKTVMFCE